MAGTTYHDLNILLSSIRESGYLEGRWARDQSPKEKEVQEEEDEVEAVNGSEAIENNTETREMLGQTSASEPDQPAVAQPSQEAVKAVPAQTPVKQEVSPSFNFLQESQIDLESPHMDPAVVMVHPSKGPVQPSGGESAVLSLTDAIVGLIELSSYFALKE